MADVAGSARPDAPSSPAFDDLRLALNATEQLGRDLICRLARDPSQWLGADCNQAARRLGVREPTLTAALTALAPTLENARALADEQRDACRRSAVDAVILGQAAYPSALLDLELAPPVLFVRGRLPVVRGGDRNDLVCSTRSARIPGIAIVGPRRPDPYGLEVARLFARRFAEAGLVVVSGFARGIDAAAHEAAATVAGGRTLAVLGCGLDVDYPAGHERLRRLIAENGALISEFPLGVPPAPWQFPVRNRIIAALPFATLVAQATARSGSLITARLAIELGRDVLAVPGRLFDKRSQGTNALLRDGAAVALHPDEILEVLPTAIAEAAHPTSPTTARACSRSWALTLSPRKRWPGAPG